MSPTTEGDPDPVVDEYMLAAFPENYRLFEHRRVSSLENPNARGPSDRRDVYLYGHPQGRKKRFRSPADFLPHLLWLAMDESGDPENCSCKLCTPEDMIKAGDEMYVLQRKLFGISTQENEPQVVKSQGVAVQNKDVAAEAPGRPLSSTPKLANAAVKRPLSAQPQEQLQKLTLKPSPSPAPTAQLATNTQIVEPTPLVAPKNQEQLIDSQPNKFIYRPGEIVWYQRNSGVPGAVGLAVITARDSMKDKQGHHPVYVAQPLSHPYNHPPSMLISQERDLKPWLAFSTPPCFHKSLRGVQHSFEQIDWRGLLNGIYGEGDTEADGSMFAAKAVDASYTPFEPISSTNGETRYNGIFIGGEKVWVGEAIRLRPGTGQDIMILSEIVERSYAGNRPQDVQVVGDVYSYRTITYNPNRQIPRNHYLPIRVQQDLEFRNRPSIKERSVVSHWKLIHARAQLSISEVKGRWYESRFAIPIVLGQEKLTEAVFAGDVFDIGGHLNSRGDSSGTSGKVGLRKNSRLEAFGGSVPASIQIGGGIQLPQQQQQQQQQPRAQPQQPQQQQQRPQQQNFQKPTRPASVNANHARNGGAAVDTEMTDYVDVEHMGECSYSQNFIDNLGGDRQY